MMFSRFPQSETMPRGVLRLLQHRIAELALLGMSHRRAAVIHHIAL